MRHGRFDLIGIDTDWVLEGQLLLLSGPPLPPTILASSICERLIDRTGLVCLEPRSIRPRTIRFLLFEEDTVVVAEFGSG